MVGKRRFRNFCRMSKCGEWDKEMADELQSRTHARSTFLVENTADAY